MNQFLGVSTLDAGITTNIQLGSSAVGVNYNLSLIVVYDALIQIDVVNQQCSLQK